MKLKLFFGFFLLFNSANLFSESEWETLKQLMRDDKLDEFSKILDQNPKLIDKQDKSGMSLLMIACTNDKPDFAKCLMDRKANVSLQNCFPGAPDAKSIAKIYSLRTLAMIFLNLIGFKK